MSLDTIYIVNRIRLLSPPEREAKLRELLARFPAEWLPQADALLHEELTKRKAADLQSNVPWWMGKSS